MKLHPLGLAKRRLFKQIWVCAHGGGAGTDAHLAAIKSFHAAAWECFAARKVDPPELKTDYVYATRQGGEYRSCQDDRSRLKAAKPTVDPRLKKAIIALERDCEFCWQELHRAIDTWDNGTRSKIRAIDALSKWQKQYNKRWDVWLARQRKLPAGLRKTQDFIKAHGQIYYVAGSEKTFGTVKEAVREVQQSKDKILFDSVTETYNSDENQKLCSLFDAGRFDELAAALDTLDAQEKEENE